MGFKKGLYAKEIEKLLWYCPTWLESSNIDWASSQTAHFLHKPLQSNSLGSALYNSFFKNPYSKFYVALIKA